MGWSSWRSFCRGSWGAGSGGSGVLGGDDMPEAEMGGEGPPVQILGARTMTEGMFER